eukprot:3395754-Amphidinium_carterae.2
MQAFMILPATINVPEKAQRSKREKAFFTASMQQSHNKLLKAELAWQLKKSLQGTGSENRCKKASVQGQSAALLATHVAFGTATHAKSVCPWTYSNRRHGVWYAWGDKSVTQVAWKPKCSIVLRVGRDCWQSDGPTYAE